MNNNDQHKAKSGMIYSLSELPKKLLEANTMFFSDGNRAFHGDYGYKYFPADMELHVYARRGTVIAQLMTPMVGKLVGASDAQIDRVLLHNNKGKDAEKTIIEYVIDNDWKLRKK